MEIQMALAEIEKKINSENWSVRCSTFQACAGRSDVPLEWLKMGVNDWNWRIHSSTFQACVGRSDVPLEWLRKGVKDVKWSVRCVTFQACVGRSDIPLRWLKRGFKDKEYEVCYSAFKACAGRNDIPLKWLKMGLNGEYSGAGGTVSKILFDMGYQFPLIRTIEPAGKVYKKCRNNVIVVAEIPKTAQVRGCIGGKCRASEAVIIEIIPNEDGYLKAVSLYDIKTSYKVADHVVIDDFDHSNVECSTGFHFFNTLEKTWNFF